MTGGSDNRRPGTQQPQSTPHTLTQHPQAPARAVPLGTPLPESQSYGVKATGPNAATVGPDGSILHADSGNIDLVPGSRLGQFELMRELGRGGMGQVFLARDTRLARLVALKFLGHASAQLTERFLVEAKATARCQHENIVVIYEADEWHGKPYMALEYLEGETLSKMIEGRTLAPSRVLELIVPVVRALERAHQHGIVHCDLKPDNILVTREGVVKVLDFGIARALGQASYDLAAGAQNVGISGTLPYMSPEQWGFDTIDHRTDLWALGIILWEMLTARHPLGDPNQGVLITAAHARHEPMPRIGQVMPDCPAVLEKAIDRCLAKDKTHRYETARALLDVLEPELPGRHGRRLAADENPYPGLTSFQEGDADRFFGRDRDVVHMVRRMADHPLVGVVAPSGVGKSSFLRAGVIPALRASGETWEVLVTRPGRSPLASLASLLQPLTQSAPDARGALQEHEAFVARVRNEPGFLGTLLRARAQQKQSRILLFVDQFEELYTLCPDADERRAYTAVLAGVADDAASPLRVVVAMRSDLLDRVAEDRVFMDRLARGLLFLPPVDREGMRSAITSPLAMVGYRLEYEGMVDEMLDALAGASGTLPLLQFTAAMLWDARDRSRRVLTASSYHAIGGVGGALATHADHVLAALTPEHQKLARAIFLRLITAEGTRAIVDYSVLTSLGAQPDAVSTVLDQLVAARLLVVERRDDGAVVELVHESLITRWPMLRRWLDETVEHAAFLEQLRTAAKQWEARGRAQGLLWTGEAMEEAQTFARRFTGELPERERSFLQAVLELGTRATRRKRRLVIGAFIVLAGLSAAAVAGLLYVRNAEQVAQVERQRAVTEAERAREAEAKVTAQVGTIQKQLDLIKEKEAARAREEQARVAAENTKAKVEESLASAETEVAEKEEDLAKANSVLRKSFAEAKAETKRAEAASAALEKALAREQARVKELEDKMKQLATKLR